MFDELSPPYRTIVADPPWKFASSSTKADASKHYTTTSTDDLAKMPVADLAADDAHLWCWAVNGMMEDAYRLVRAWGFILGWDGWGFGVEARIAS